MQLRMREPRQNDKLGGHGDGRLTLDKCNRLQSYYRNGRRTILPCEKNQLISNGKKVMNI